MGIFSRKKTDATPEAKAAPVAAPKAAAKSVAKTAVKATAKPAAKSAVATVATAKQILKQVVITEKASVNNTYIFKVEKTATKSEVSKAFKVKYGKTPRKVNIVNVMGKTKARGNQIGKRSDWKKAIVYLNKGETVDLYQ